ncbi:hypothetical protein VKT23_002359 [Stygiomarasmius scandens]|uniref:Uncharacterized protein n=1 Tax=Marasmiellus scandens TaxID=2682957 RepID=A0ABR1K4H2_9AGAR
MYRSPSPSPYMSPDPYGGAPGSPFPATQPAGAQITPGSITYTTSTDPLTGRMVYHPFKAVPASYQTPSGIVSGIQWVPAEATQILPAGAQPATAEFAEAWNRSTFSKDEQQALKEWQRGEEKRRRKEEKESARMLRDRQARNEDPDLRWARERDAVTRERRKSFNAGGPPQHSFPATTTPGPYSPNPYGGGYAGSNSGSYGTSSPSLGFTRDVERQFADMGFDHRDPADPLVGTRPRKYSTHETMADKTRRLSGNFGPERPASTYGQSVVGGPGTTGFVPPARPYSRNQGNAYPGGAGYTNPSPNMRSADLPYGSTAPRPVSPYSGMNPRPISPYHGAATGARPVSPYHGAATGARPVSPYHGGPYRAPSRAPSPNHPGTDPYLRSTSPLPIGGDIYPPGHVMEGQPILARSRPTTPSRGMGMPLGGGVGFPTSAPFPNPSPHIGQQGQLSTPECFHRPINAAHSYTHFEPMKIMDMDSFLETIPRMPAVLQPHDVYIEDWNRLMEDVALAWSGRLPVPTSPDGLKPKRATLAANLIALWNGEFFERRGIELVLYKGRERRSGARAGVVDLPMPSLDDIDSLSSSSSSSDDDDDDDLRYSTNSYGGGGGGNYGGYYGRPGYGQPDMASEERQRRLAAKADKKRRKKEKKIRKKVKASEKKYTLYLTSVPTAGLGGPVGHVGSIGSGGYGGF